MMKDVDKLLRNLQEREKELNCLYKIEEILNNANEIEDALNQIITVIPSGWQFPNACQARIKYGDREYASPNFKPTPWKQTTEIEVGSGLMEGGIEVYYTEEMPVAFEGPFLEEERKLLDNIADRVGKHIFHVKSKSLMNEWEAAKAALQNKGLREWQVIVDLLRRTDHELFFYVARKMTYFLCWNGIKEAQKLLRKFDINRKTGIEEDFDDVNRPSPKISFDMLELASQTFEIAPKYFADADILANIQQWIQENKTNFLVQVLAAQYTSIDEIANAIRRFHHLMPDASSLPDTTRKALNSALVRRFFTGQPQFVRLAREYISINDMHELIKRMIYSPRSRGRLGGKSAGLFLAAQILKKVHATHPELQQVKTPKTWFITSDGMIHFMYFNNLEGLIEQKYKPVEQVRLEYPHTIQIFKNSPFPPELIKGLSVALDDLGNNPIIVRSSSLLEDRLGTVFSGKYKSLFLANQGSKTERLEALMDAIAEVYASIFGPDPIEYRAERGLAEFHEEMGIMIQQVVGAQVGHYFLPSYAGVAFSNNEFRWSPRIQRKDGLIRLVPGLGTRAVDRVSDDYPVLIAPGQPNLRVNVTIDEKIRYAPQRVDVINLKTNTFETIEFSTLIQECADQIPALNQIVSLVNGDHLTTPSILTDFSEEDVIVTFEGLRENTRFVDQVRKILTVLEEKMETAIDLEFASDGKDLYLLQCRPQSAFHQNEAAPIPKDIAPEKTIFSANKFVSNGHVQDITHLVYVDPEAYSNLRTHEELIAVGRAVSKLNKLLPKRQFILMGPGRWGSRGDIKLGVNVTYSDINNTAALVEIALKKGNYVPELSFGTHFFQDLVEASIRYLPLYPNSSDGVAFNTRFLKRSPNILAQILPEYAHLSDTIKVIDIPKTVDGQVMTLAMNADLDEALAYLTVESERKNVREMQPSQMTKRSSDDYWRWRLQMANNIAQRTDPQRFGVKAFYLIGSAKNAKSGPASDIDLLIHFDGTTAQRKDLETWLEGWSLCLDEMNYLRTGYRTGGLLDVHLVTDEDIEQKSSFAVKIGAITDAAMELPMQQS